MFDPVSVSELSAAFWIFWKDSSPPTCVTSSRARLNLKSPAGAAASLPFVLKRHFFFAGVPHFRSCLASENMPAAPRLTNSLLLLWRAFFVKYCRGKKSRINMFSLQVFDSVFSGSLCQECWPTVACRSRGRVQQHGRGGEEEGKTYIHCSYSAYEYNFSGQDIILFIQSVLDVQRGHFPQRSLLVHTRCVSCLHLDNLNTLIYYSRQLQNKKTWLKFFRASTSRNGTCLTSTECTDRSGTIAGNCAAGHGLISLHL